MQDVEDIAQSVLDNVSGRQEVVGKLSKRVQAVRAQTINRRLADLPVERLQAIEARLHDQSEHIVETLEEFERKGKEAIAEADWQRYELIRTEAVEAVRDFDELQDLRKRVTDARNERVLNDRLAERLGSHRNRKLYDIGIMVLIALVVGMLLYEMLAQPSAEVTVVLDWIDIGACVLFLCDFFWRHSLAESKGWFWRRHWIDFITSIPLPSAHTLRLGRTVRLVRLFRMIRVVRLARILRIILFFWRGMDKLSAAFDVRMMRRSVNILVAILVAGGLGIYVAEGAPGVEGVEDVGQSFWWSFTTVVTGGFGDIHNPQTVTGRLLTGALVIAGMVVVGIFTATLTSLLVRENDASGAILALEDRMLEELEDIRVLLRDATSEETLLDISTGGDDTKS
ncbi:MAG: ion transporter [Myxococcales bacterium]|nr:ion transporter [Myxococcales bacterium]MCB9751569.1 ion transporter [Myxococcales bacterium]